MSGIGTTDPGNQSSAEIEREVESTRAGLNDTLGQLRERAAPGKLFEEALDYARSSGGMEFMRNLGSSLRDNPLPVVLIGAGIGWMMMSGDNGGSSRGGSSVGRGDHDGYARFDSSARNDRSGHAGGSAGEGMIERAGDAADRVRGGAGEMVERAADRVKAAGDRVGHGMSEAQDRLGRLGHDARDQVSEIGERASESLGRVMREQPLILGAVGLAIGAALGALLPATEAEDRLMGERSDVAVRAAKRALSDSVERVQGEVGPRLDRAGQAIEERMNNDSTDGMGEAVGRVARDVRKTVTSSVQALGREARESLQGEPQTMPGNDERTQTDQPKSTPTSTSRPVSDPVPV